MKISKIITTALSLTLLSGITASSYNYDQYYRLNASAENTIAEKEYTLGDVNNDSQVNAVDASAVLSYYALVATSKEGGFSDAQTSAADVNNDSTVNAVDASGILAYYAYASTAKGSIKPLAEFIGRDLSEDKPVLERLHADINKIYINTEENVKFTIKVNSDEPLPDKTLALYDNSDTLVSYMSDDGKNGDEKANDGIYSVQLCLGSEKAKNVDYYAATDSEKSNKRRICFYRAITDDDIKGFNKVVKEVSGKSFEEACDYVKNSDEIMSYVIDEEEKSLSYHTIYGIQALWLPPGTESDDGFMGRGEYALRDSEMKVPDDSDTDYYALMKNKKLTQEKLKQLSFKPAHNRSHKVAVLETIRSTGDKMSDSRDYLGYIGEYVTYALNKYSLWNKSLDEILKSELFIMDRELYDTYYTLQNLQGYEVILCDAHGAKILDDDYIKIGREIPSVVALDVLLETIPMITVNGEVYHESVILDENLKEIYADFNSGALTFMPDDDIHIDKYDILINQHFFDNHYEDGDLDGSIWAIDGCSVLSNDNLANTLIEKGAETVIGFSNDVLREYAFNTFFEVLVNSMVLSADTVGNGVSEAKRLFGSIDPIADEKLHLKTELRVVGNTDYRLIDIAETTALVDLYDTPGPLCISFAPLDTGTSSDERMIDVLEILHKNLVGSDRAYYTTYAGDVGLCFGRKHFLSGSQYGQYDSFDEILDCARSMDNAFSLIHEKAYSENYPLAGVSCLFDNRKDPNRKHAQDNDDGLLEVLMSEYQQDTFNILNPLITSGESLADYWYSGNTTSIVTIIKDDYYYDDHGGHNGNDPFDEYYNGNYFQNAVKAKELGIPFIENVQLRNDDGTFQMPKGAHVHNRVHYMIDLRDEYDYELANLCRESGGKYIRYSEDSKEIYKFIGLINERRKNTITR